MSRWKTERSRAGLLLIEIIIAVGIFSLCCAVCVQMFAHAHMLNIESRELSNATICAQSAAEAFKVANGSMEKTAEYLDAHYYNGYVVLVYDENWDRFYQEKNTEKAGYRMIITPFASEGIAMAKISIGKPVYLPDGKVDKGAEDNIYTLFVKEII